MTQPEDFEDAFKRALEVSCEELTAEAFHRGRASMREEAAREIDELARIWREQNHDPSIDSAYRNAAAAVRKLEA